VGRAPGAWTGDSYGPEPEAANLDVTADRKGGVRHRSSMYPGLVRLIAQSVAGLACPHHQSFLFELLDQDRDRWLRQALELSELGDPPRAAAEGLSVHRFAVPARRNDSLSSGWICDAGSVWLVARG
jgi:hypothetical protein